MIDAVAPPVVTLLGKAEPVRIPTHYALLLELTAAYEDAATTALRLSVTAGMIVVCCPDLSRMAFRAGHDYAKSGYDPVAFGRGCLHYLHGQGVGIPEIVAGGRVLQPLLSEAAFPTDAEVSEALGKSTGPGA